LACLLGRAELKGSYFVVHRGKPGDLFVSQGAALEDERQQVVPRSMRWHPVHHQKPTDGDVQAEFFAYLTLCRLGRWFVGLGHAARCVPVRLVGRIDEEEPSGLITDQGVGADPLAWLGGVAFGQVCPPRFRVALVQRGLRHEPSSYPPVRSEEHTSELQSRENIVCRLLLEKKKETSD